MPDTVYDYMSTVDILTVSCEVLGMDTTTAVTSAKVPLVDSAAAKPQAGFGNCEVYPTIAAKAAALLFGLTRNHPFIDGNKRTAVLATVFFLLNNDYRLDLSDTNEAFDMVVRVAAGGVSIGDTAAWLAERMVPTGDRVAVAV